MNHSNETQIMEKSKDGVFLGGTMNEWMEHCKDLNEWSENAIKDKDGTIHFGKWTVAKSGYMVYDNWYDIDEKRLSEDDWIYHLFSKGWIDWNEFMPAYFQALSNAKIQFVNIRIFYKPGE